MRYLFTTSLFISCFLSVWALGQDVITVPLVDKTIGHSPFEVSGRALLRERARANELEWSWGEKVMVKNISDKAILLFVASLTEFGRHTASENRHTAPGNGATYMLEEDRFFSDRLVLPGDSLVLRDTQPTGQNLTCCINPLAEMREPLAEYRLLFVQFADGSTLGDEAEAADAMAMRETILSGMRELLEFYAERGPSGFSSKLMERSAFSATSVYKQIFAKYSNEGLQAALSQTNRILTIAKQHAVPKETVRAP